MILGIEQFSIGVADLERSLRFWRDGLGFREVLRAELGTAAAERLGSLPRPLRGATLECGDLRIEILAFAESAGAVRNEAAGAPCGLSHLTLLVDDLASTLHSLRDRGIEPTRPPVEHARGLASCVLRDPDGLSILLLQRPAGTDLPGPTRRSRQVEPMSR